MNVPFIISPSNRRIAGNYTGAVQPEERFPEQVTHPSIPIAQRPSNRPSGWGRKKIITRNTNGLCRSSPPAVRRLFAVRFARWDMPAWNTCRPIIPSPPLVFCSARPSWQQEGGGAGIAVMGNWDPHRCTVGPGWLGWSISTENPLLPSIPTTASPSSFRMFWMGRMRTQWCCLGGPSCAVGQGSGPIRAMQVTVPILRDDDGNKPLAAAMIS